VTHKNLIALTYIGVSLAAGGLYCLSPCIAVWIGLNTAGQTKRAAAISITVVAAQLGGLAGSNIYIASEKRTSVFDSYSSSAVWPTSSMSA
jgi:hypothetical protein